MKSPSSINSITSFKKNIRLNIPLIVNIEEQTTSLIAPNIEVALTTNTLDFNPIYGKAKLYIYGELLPAHEVQFNCNLYPYLISINGVSPEEHELEVKLYFENGYSTTWSNKLLLEIS